MTTKEKLEKALEALRFIAAGKCEIVGSDVMYATTVHAHLTTPRTKPVEVKRWLHKYKVNLYSDIEPIHNLEDWVELAGTYQQPIPEPEMLEGYVLESIGKGSGIITEVPYSWIGRRVIVEVCEG